jgi:hypothetical protein
MLRLNPLRMMAGRQKKRPVITCHVCGAEMKIIRTQITLPLVVRVATIIYGYRIRYGQVS